MKEEFSGFSCYCKTPPLRVVASFFFAGPQTYKELLHKFESEKKHICPIGLPRTVQHSQREAGRKDLVPVPGSATG